MRKLTDVLGLVLVALVLLLVPSSQVAAASAPGVHAASMGVDPQGGGAVLVVNGTGLNKVCDEGGPIRPGDLLVTSSIPGHAMKAPANVRPGTILGKALGRLDSGAGVMEVLLSLQ